MSRRSKSLAFYVEALLLTLFLLVAAATLLRVFGAAAAHGRRAEDNNAAALITQNVIATFVAGAAPLDTPGTYNLTYSNDGVETPDGSYHVIVTVETVENDAPGTMLRARMSVSDVESTAFYIATSERYLPAA